VDRVTAEGLAENESAQFKRKPEERGLALLSRGPLPKSGRERRDVKKMQVGLGHCHGDRISPRASETAGEKPLFKRFLEGVVVEAARVLARRNWRSTATHSPQLFGFTVMLLGLDYEPRSEGDIVRNTP
jgi:hypothetical protein